MPIEAKQKPDSSCTSDTTKDYSVLNSIPVQNTDEGMPEEVDQKSVDSGKPRIGTANIDDKTAMESNTETNPTTDTAGPEAEPEPKHPNTDQNEQTNIRRSQRSNIINCNIILAGPSEV